MAKQDYGGRKKFQGDPESVGYRYGFAKPGTRVRVPDEAQAVLICERMGWTFTQYLQQPTSRVAFMLRFQEGRERGRQARAELGDDDA